MNGLDFCERRLAVAGFGNNLEHGVCFDHLPQSPPYDRVIVGDQNPEFSRHVAIVHSRCE